MSAERKPLDYTVYPCSYANGWCAETLGHDDIWQFAGRYETKEAAVAAAKGAARHG